MEEESERNHKVQVSGFLKMLGRNCLKSEKTEVLAELPSVFPCKIHPPHQFNWHGGCRHGGHHAVTGQLPFGQSYYLGEILSRD